MTAGCIISVLIVNEIQFGFNMDKNSSYKNGLSGKGQFACKDG